MTNWLNDIVHRELDNPTTGSEANEPARSIDLQPRPNYGFRRLGAAAAIGLVLFGGYEAGKAVTHVDTVASADVALPPSPQGDDIMEDNTPYSVRKEAICDAAQKLVQAKNADGEYVIPRGINKAELAGQCETVAEQFPNKSGGDIKLNVEKDFWSQYYLTAEDLDRPEA